MNEKITFDIHPSKKLQLKESAKKNKMSLSQYLNNIVIAYLENENNQIESESESEQNNSVKSDHEILKRIEDKLDYLLIHHNPPQHIENDIHSKLVSCIKSNKKHIGVLAMVEFMEIFPELRTAK